MAAKTSEARLRANAKWAAENIERLTIKFYKGKTPSKDDIKAAAERDGMSVNAWILAAIADKL